jgi:hypothetical protein
MMLTQGLMRRSQRRNAREGEVVEPVGQEVSASPDDLLLAKIVSLLRTLPFGERHASSSGESMSDPQPARPAVRPIGSSRNAATCICSNLIAVSEAFSELTDEELLAVPEDVRDHARGELIGVWKVLDLLQRMEATHSQLLAES